MVAKEDESRLVAPPAVGRQPLSPNWKVEAEASRLAKRTPAWVFATVAMSALLLVVSVLLLMLSGDSVHFGDQVGSYETRREKQVRGESRSDEGLRTSSGPGSQQAAGEGAAAPGGDTGANGSEKK